MHTTRAKIVSLSGVHSYVEVMPDHACKLHILVDGKPKGTLTFENVMQQRIVEVCPNAMLRVYVDEEEKD